MGSILTINVGSSSIRTATFLMDGANLDPRPTRNTDCTELADCFKEVGNVSAIAHRVVHVGVVEEDAAILGVRILERIREGIALAPNHNQKVLNAIEMVSELFEEVPQIAVYDSAFHRTIPLHAAIYPGPYEWYERLFVKRLGFHGLSHRYASEKTLQMLGRDAKHVVTAHIGNGVSLAAIKDGSSVDTTMGFTPLEGLMMGQRSGTIDPGIIFYLMQKEFLTASEMERLVSTESGLLGTSGLSADFRDILKARNEGHQRASLAFEMYVHRLRRGIGEMAAAMDGLDALVFTGGVGEHSPVLRSAICSGLSSFGIKLDDLKNDSVAKDGMISHPGGTASVLVVESKENWMMARAAMALLNDISH